MQRDARLLELEALVKKLAQQLATAKRRSEGGAGTEWRLKYEAVKADENATMLYRTNAERAARAALGMLSERADEVAYLKSQLSRARASEAQTEKRCALDQRQAGRDAKKDAQRLQ